MLWLFLVFPLVLFADWAEETLAQMTLDEKIGQLFMAPACPLRKEDHWYECQKRNRIARIVPTPKNEAFFGDPGRQDQRPPQITKRYSGAPVAPAG